jgi:hypothetical protein
VYLRRQLGVKEASAQGKVKAGLPPLSEHISRSLDYRAMEKIMNTLTKGLLGAFLFSLPVAAFAQSNDAAYCKALVAKYEQYLDMSSKKGEQPQNLERRAFNRAHSQPL